MCKLHFKALALEPTSIRKVRFTSNELGKEFTVRCENHDPKFETSEIFNVTAIEDRAESKFEYDSASDIYEVLKHLDQVKVYTFTETGKSSKFDIRYMTIKGNVKESGEFGDISYNIDYKLPEISTIPFFDIAYYSSNGSDEDAECNTDNIDNYKKVVEIQKPKQEHIEQPKKEVIKKIDNEEIFEQDDTELISGPDFNRSVKELVMKAKGARVTTECTNVVAFKRTNNKLENLPSLKISKAGKAAWVYYSEHDETLYLYTKANVIFANRDMSHMLRGFSKLLKADAIAEIDFRNTTDMASMLHGTAICNANCIPAKTVHSVIDLNSMFKNCCYLTNIDSLKDINWDGVVDVEDIFSGCSILCYKGKINKLWPRGINSKNWDKGTKKRAARTK